MTGPASQNNHQEAAAQREAELTDLLGHVTQCWDDERRQLARKLHDHLGSSLTALTMHLSLLAAKLPAEKPLQDRVGQMKTLLNQIVTTNREMQLTLWNDKLEFLGVKAAVHELVADFDGRHAQLTARASLPEDDVQVSRDQGVAVLRVVEEGLRNIERHAQASAVEVVIDDNEDECMVTVRDNGVGQVRIGGGRPDCHGLRLLRERVQFLGGTLTVRDHPDGGTALTAHFPKTPE